MKRFAVVVVAIVLMGTAAWAQMGPGGGGMRAGRGPMYDPSKAETVTGQVTEVREFTSRNGMHQGIGLTVKSGDKDIKVHLGPKFYLDEQPVKIAKGDTVEITGVKTDRWGQDVFIAGQVKKNGEILKLHDENGRPMWAGKGPGAGGPGTPGGPATGTADQAKPRPKAPVGC